MIDFELIVRFSNFLWNEEKVCVKTEGSASNRYQIVSEKSALKSETEVNEDNQKIKRGNFFMCVI